MENQTAIDEFDLPEDESELNKDAKMAELRRRVHDKSSSFLTASTRSVPKRRTTG